MYHGWTMKLVKTLGCWPSNILKVLGIHLPTHGLLPIIKHGLPENPILKKKKCFQIKTSVWGFLSHVWWNRRVLIVVSCCFRGVSEQWDQWGSSCHGMPSGHCIHRSRHVLHFRICHRPHDVQRIGTYVFHLAPSPGTRPTLIDWDSMTKVKRLIYLYFTTVAMPKPGVKWINRICWVCTTFCVMLEWCSSF